MASQRRNIFRICTDGSRALLLRGQNNVIKCLMSCGSSAVDLRGPPPPPSGSPRPVWKVQTLGGDARADPQAHILPRESHHASLACAPTLGWLLSHSSCLSGRTKGLIYSLQNEEENTQEAKPLTTHRVLPGGPDSTPKTWQTRH